MHKREKQLGTYFTMTVPVPVVGRGQILEGRKLASLETALIAQSIFVGTF